MQRTQAPWEEPSLRTKRAPHSSCKLGNVDSHSDGSITCLRVGPVFEAGKAYLGPLDVEPLGLAIQEEVDVDHIPPRCQQNRRVPEASENATMMLLCPATLQASEHNALAFSTFSSEEQHTYAHDRLAAGGRDPHLQSWLSWTAVPAQTSRAAGRGCPCQ